MLGWAVPVGAAHHLFASPHRKGKPAASTSLATRKASRYQLPRSVFFREVPGRGLLVRLWVNGFGPYNFAIDTGAGATIMSPRVTSQAGVTAKLTRANRIGGLSGIINTVAATEVQPGNLAIGYRDNFLPSTGIVLMADIFPSDIDGILDPTESYWPLGYVIDFPGSKLSAFDPGLSPLHLSEAPADGTIVPWVRDGSGRRPYVLLDDGQKALLDTGSEFGLALSDNGSSNGNSSRRSSSNRAVRDLGGGTISARRVAPLTVAIGSLSLRRIPTDLIAGKEREAPVLLGRAALRPFRLSFDPVSRLIEIAPVTHARQK